VQQLLELAKAVYPTFPFEYGYAHSLTDQFEPISEIKVRKTFGGISMKGGPAGSTWLYHMLGIRHGFLKGVYPKNILNSSQTANSLVANLNNQGAGQLEPFVADLQLWSLSESQIPRALDLLSTSGSVISDDKGRDAFLRRNEAREFHEAMFPKRV
jgi:hypothetical protein